MFNLTDKAFEEVTKLIMNLANKNCEGRILSILEGGYNIEGNSKATIKHVKTLKKFNLMFIILNFIDKKVFLVPICQIKN